MKRCRLALAVLFALFTGLLPLMSHAADKAEPGPQDKDAPIVAFCHHGGRSAQVTAWLRQQGWTNVVNMTGGIHAWAQSIDPAVGTY